MYERNRMCDYIRGGREKQDVGLHILEGGERNRMCDYIY